MVGAVNLCVDFTVYYKIHGVGYKIVNSPSCVFLPGAEAIAPPGIGYGVGIEGAEGIVKARCQKL